MASLISSSVTASPRRSVAKGATPVTLNNASDYRANGLLTLTLTLTLTLVRYSLADNLIVGSDSSPLAR